MWTCDGGTHDEGGVDEQGKIKGKQKKTLAQGRLRALVGGDDFGDGREADVGE